MSRPSTEAQYLASLVPPSVAATGIGRRSLLKGALAGAGFLGASGLLAACGSSGSSGRAAAAAAPGRVRHPDLRLQPVRRRCRRRPTPTWSTGFNDRRTIKVTINTVDHNTFQENINTYLQGQPGRRLHLVRGLPDAVLRRQGPGRRHQRRLAATLTGFSDALKTASTGDDGKQYFVPLDNYPWAIFYRKSVFAGEGLPGAEDPRRAGRPSSTQMQKDGLIPIAFADKDGWPAMGTFDQLNMRINGYDFHVRPDGRQGGVGLRQGQEGLRHLEPACSPTTSPTRSAAPGRRPRSRCSRRRPGMYVLGMFVGQQFTKGAEQDDLDFFAFPEVDSTIGTDAIEAPIDGFMMAGEAEERGGGEEVPRLPRHARPRRASTSRPTRPSSRSTPSADTSGYTALQKKAVEFVGGAKNISQFLDRDTRPDFASTVMIPALQHVHQEPERHRRAHQEHREPEEVDLRRPERRTAMTARPTAALRAGPPAGGGPRRTVRAGVDAGVRTARPASTASSSR